MIFDDVLVIYSVVLVNFLDVQIYSCVQGIVLSSRLFPVDAALGNDPENDLLPCYFRVAVALEKNL